MTVAAAIALYGVSVGCVLLATAIARFFIELTEDDGSVSSLYVLTPFFWGAIAFFASGILWILVWQGMDDLLMITIMGLGIYTGLEWIEKMGEPE